MNSVQAATQILPSQKESLVNRYGWSVPLLGVGTGTALGVAQKLWDSGGPCFLPNPVLHAVNQPKKWESDHTSTLTPLALLGIQCVTDAMRAPADHPFSERLKNEVKKLGTAENAIYGATITTFALMGVLISRAAGKPFTGFSPIITRTLWSIFAARNLYLKRSESRVERPQTQNQVGGSPWVMRAVSIAALTDILFLSHYSYRFSVTKSLVNVVTASSIAAVAELAIRLRARRNSASTKIDEKT